MTVVTGACRDERTPLSENDFDPDDADDVALLEQVGERIGQVLESTLEETEDLDLPAALAVLHERLAAIEEVDFELDWCREVLEALRRGDEVNIELG